MRIIKLVRFLHSDLTNEKIQSFDPERKSCTFFATIVMRVF